MEYETRIKIVNAVTKVIRKAAGCLLALAVIVTGAGAWDMYSLTAAGLGSEDFPGFEELLARNPDTVAWITLDGTHINHPVVRGRDNYEYLTKGFDGEFYQGGSIFLDAGCSGDMSDEYLIIHGHHMTGGAMFSDLSLYLDEDFFEENSTGELITPGGRYALKVCGAGTADAYDSGLYTAGPGVSMPLDRVKMCALRRDAEFGDSDKLVALSTCYGDMTTARTVVFCRAEKI